MPSRLSAVVASTAAVLPTLACGVGPAGAHTVRHHDHRHHPHHRLAAPRRHILPVQVTGDQPGWQQMALSLPAPSYVVRTQAQLSAALQSAQPGQVIQLASGASFSSVLDSKARSGWVTVSGAGDAVPPTIAGAQLEGSQYLRFTNVEFISKVFIGRSPTKGTAQPAANIQLLNSEVNCGSTQTGGAGGAPKTTGLMIRQAAENVTIAGDYVHACTLGLTTIAQDNPTQNLVITHDLFDNFYGDAIDLGGNNDTTITENIIADIAHSPGTIYHDDGIQFLGNTNNTTIQDNVLDNSNDQLLFVQDAVRGRFNGVQTNSNLLVDHNLIYGAGAAAVQDEGAVNFQFVNNTVWDSHDGALIVRASPYTHTSATQSVIEDNILQSYIQMSAPQAETDNILTWPTPHKAYGPGDQLGVTPQFVSAATGDFAVTQAAPGATSPSTAAAPAAATTLGAEPADVAYGAPLYGTPGS